MCPFSLLSYAQTTEQIGMTKLMNDIITRFITYCKGSLRRIFLSHNDPEAIARSFCIGLYIAFSPFPGLHGVMMLGAQAVFGLHFPVLFFATSLNNPWTMIPFYSLDYSFGYWLLHSALELKPTWTLSLAKVFGSGTICIWSFLAGGNILGLIGALICYYPLKVLLSKRKSSHLSSTNTR